METISITIGLGALTLWSYNESLSSRLALRVLTRVLDAENLLCGT